MTLRKPKHDNFSKLGLKIDRLNHTRNNKNIQNIVSYINRQEREYKLTDFDILLYHVYSKPLSSCLNQPTEEVDKNSPRSLQEQDIAFKQMNQYLKNLKELRGELENDSKMPQRARLRRFSVSSEDQNSELDDSDVNNIIGKVSKFQFQNKLKSALKSSNKILNTSNQQSNHLSFLKDLSIAEQFNYNSKERRNAFARSGQHKYDKNMKYRSKTEEGNSYSDDSSEILSSRQEFPKLFDVDTLKQRKDQINQQQLNMFYGTKANIQKTDLEERILKEELEELQHKNRFKLKQIELKNEQLNEGNASTVHSTSIAKKKLSDNINNLQFYDKILPQNASLTKHPQAFNSVIKDAYKKQQQRLRGENTAAQDQEFERKIINILHSPNHKIMRRGGLRDDLFTNKLSKDKLKPLTLSTIQTTLSPKQESPNTKQVLKERVSQILDNFNVKSLEMDYQLKKSRAFINQEEDSDLEDTQTFDKRLYMEKRKISQIKPEQLESEHDTESVYYSDEGEKQQQNQDICKMNAGTPIRQVLSPSHQTGFGLKKRSTSPNKSGLHKIFNKSLCSSLAGSQILSDVKSRKQGLNPISLEKSISSPSENENVRLNILSPTNTNNNKGNSVLMTTEQIKKFNENRRMTAENIINTPPRIKLISASPKNEFFPSKEQNNFYNDAASNHFNNTATQSNQQNTLRDIKSNIFGTPLILANKLSPLQRYEDVSIIKHEQNKVSQIQNIASNEKQTSINQQIETPFTAKSRQKIRSEFQSQTKKQTIDFERTNKQNKEIKKSINFDLNFTSRYEQVEVSINSEQRCLNQFGSPLSPSQRFYSQSRKVNSQIKAFPDLAKIDSIQSDVNQNSSIQSYQSQFQESSSPSNIASKGNNEDKVNQFIENRKKIYPKINWKKYKNESSLLSKMEDLSSKAKTIKQQFNTISKKFKEEINSTPQYEQQKNDAKDYLSQAVDFVKQEGQFPKESASIFDDKEKITNLIKSIEKDSINLQFYIVVQDQINSEKKKYEEDSRIQNIQAYHLSESPMLKHI